MRTPEEVDAKAVSYFLDFKRDSTSIFSLISEIGFSQGCGTLWPVVMQVRPSELEVHLFSCFPFHFFSGTEWA